MNEWNQWRNVVCDNLDCVLCLYAKWQRLQRAYFRADSRAERRFGTTLWLDAIDLRTRIARAKLDAWHNYESANYSSQVEVIEIKRGWR